MGKQRPTLFRMVHTCVEQLRNRTVLIKLSGRTIGRYAFIYVSCN